jgi:3-hydroxybutyryl-CoA dehydratase
MSTNFSLTTLPVVERTISVEQIRRYAIASGDRNPVHLDAEFAAHSFFGRVVAHGMLTLAFVAEMMVLAYGWHWAESGNLKVRFKKPAYPGDTLKSQGQVYKQEIKDGRCLVQCNVSLINASTGEEIITGTASVSLPIGEEKT